jgi:branched-subunit amino acid aminotransferase/4-amino-4-deoxychorismate lyase
MTAAELACLDGRILPAAEASIPVNDDGFLRGDGVFEVIRVYEGRPFALPDHFVRIERSAANLRLGYEVPRAELEREVPELIERRGAADFDGQVRIVLTRGGHRIVLTEQLPATPATARLAFVTYSPTRLLDGVKSLSYAANMLARRLAHERGFDEALFVTPHGRVLEAPTSSLFWLAPDGALCTPPLDEHILASITRDRILRILDVEERAVTSDELLDAQEAFLASTSREVQPVSAIEDKSLPAPGERTVAAAEAIAAQIQEELAATAR